VIDGDGLVITIARSAAMHRLLAQLTHGMPVRAPAKYALFRTPDSRRLGEREPHVQRQPCDLGFATTINPAGYTSSDPWEIAFA